MVVVKKAALAGRRYAVCRVRLIYDCFCAVALLLCAKLCAVWRVVFCTVGGWVGG